MKFFLILTKGLGMITTEKRFCLTKNKCLKKMSKCIALGLISGLILLPHASKDSKIMKEDSIMSTETFSKK
jgi:hypothetical protein